jgi:hypothetical protein
MKKRKRSHHQAPAKKTDNPAPATQPVPKNDAPHPNPSSNTHHENSTQAEKFNRGMLRWTRVVGAFTAVLAVVGGLQTYAFIQSERAFAALAAIRIGGNEVTPQKAVVLMLEIKNSGKSTAFIENASTTAVFLKASETLPAKPQYMPTPDVSPGPVLANGIVNVRSDVRGFNGEQRLILTEADVIAIKNGAFKFYVIGYVSYIDEFTIFGPRINGFCAFYNPGGDANTHFDNCGERAYTYSR